jgi:Mn2+/Fe2+ NRAMP family transporter
VKIILLSQALNGMVLPLVLIFMVLLVNKKELMGEYTNSRVANLVTWATTVILIGMTMVLFWSQRGDLLKAFGTP